MARGTYSSRTADRGGRTPAQWYCLLAGVALLLAGALGFIADASFDTGTAPDGTTQGDSLIGFEVNGWHNVVHLASGLVLLAAANTRPTARLVAIGFGAVYGLVALIGLIDGSDVLGIIPVNGADNVLHIALSALGIAAGLMSPTRRHGPSRASRSAADAETSPRAQASTGRFDRDPAASDVAHTGDSGNSGARGR